MTYLTPLNSKTIITFDNLATLQPIFNRPSLTQLTGSSRHRFVCEKACAIRSEMCEWFDRSGSNESLAKDGPDYRNHTSRRLGCQKSDNWTWTPLDGFPHPKVLHHDNCHPSIVTNTSCRLIYLRSLEEGCCSHMQTPHPLSTHTHLSPVMKWWNLEWVGCYGC